MKKYIFAHILKLILFVLCNSKDCFAQQKSTKNNLNHTLLTNQLNISDNKAEINITSFAKIKGVGAASGLVYADDHLYIIGDNSGFLTKYNVLNGNTSFIELLPNAAVNIPKKIKPDFESISIQGNKIMIFGSGSAENRQNQISYDINTGQIFTENLNADYLRLKKLAEIKDDEFNIEGVFFDKKFQYYCQRGNKSADKNCIFRLDRVTEEITVFYYQLPEIRGVKTTFTDAIAVDGTMFFLASAEDSNSTYLDGEIKGSYFGTIDLKTMKLNFGNTISTTNKFEGIVLYQNLRSELIFLLCEDNDSDILESEIYQLTYFKK